MSAQPIKYYSSEKRTVGAALGETLLFAILISAGVFEKYSNKNLLIALFICLVIFAIMYAIESSKRTIKSIEFMDDKMVVESSTKDAFGTPTPGLAIDLKNITRIEKKRFSSAWHIEYDNNLFKLNLYAFEPTDEDQIIATINKYTDQQSRREGR